MIERIGCTVGMLGDPEHPGDITAAVRTVEDAGYESAWTWESFGPDCFTPLAWWGSRSTSMRLGTAVAQMAARAPTAMAMAAMTLDKLSGGRMVVGLGVSGPQVVEGWYGVPFERPLGWTREYIDIMRQTMARERVSYRGTTYNLPISGGSGLGKSIRTALRDAPRTDIPIHLGAEGPKNISLAAEIADGWLPTNFSPLADDWYRERLEIGFKARPGGRPEHFEIAPAASISIGPDTETAAARLKPGIAFQVGANGAENMNFHLNAVARLGFEEPCREIQERFLARDREGMAAAVPTEMVEAIALVGTPEKIKADLMRWHDTVATSFIARASLKDLVTLAGIFHSTTGAAAEQSA
ncbi:LLM class F420-dependent oxidoreductase [Phytoactinopolyspora limicola]|uniref:LLM class F420-dependent oxidoreductase n=1 Tax=Phytoactinopolyspora limicola TaxID=2715536 RepID=UPI001A9C4C3E|nr:LLM class F420-dependent oxidoreductase [Phytoactinopolyspora limicola]